MTIAASIEKHLRQQGVRYELIEHPPTMDSSHTAQASHVPGANLAKGTVLKGADGFVIAVVPAIRQVDLEATHRRLGRDVGLAAEQELRGLFGDCEPGAVPPVGAAYGIATIVDDSLVDRPDVYFEAGDHRHLVHVSGEDFVKLLGDAPHGPISRPVG